MKLGRRTAIVGGVLGAGFVGVGWWFANERDRLGDRSLFNVKPGEAGLNGWVKIAKDDAVIVAVPRAEMGQGVHTALAMLVAEEMEARWDQVRVEDPPEHVVYRNVEILIDGLPFSPEETGSVVDMAHWAAGKLGGVLGVSATGGSTTVRDAWTPMRTAGAIARELLLMAAALKSGVPVAGLVAADGAVRRRDGGVVARFGELVDHVGDLGLMVPPPLKPAAQFKLIGKPQTRLDIPAKVVGAATFGIDVRRPGQLYAAVRHAPTFGGEVAGFALKGVSKPPSKPKGIEEIVIVPGGLAAVGTSWWQAQRFLDDGVDITWRDGPEPKLDSATLWKRYEGLLDTAAPALTRTLGSAPAAPAGQKLEAVYRAPYLAHTPMEPMNCTALFTGALELWMPNQSPTLVRLAAARAAGLAQEHVTVHTTFLGGGFGRRAEVDVAREAVACALQLPGKPVQVLWSREEDIRHDMYRPMALARWTATFDKGLATVIKRQVGQSPTDQFGKRAVGLPGQGKPEGNAVENPPYAFPYYKLEAIVPDGVVPVGFWRSVGHSHTAFFDECFLDEIALHLKQDPFAFRRTLLAGKPRHLKVLETAAREAGWGAKLPAGSGRGIALRASFGSIVAQVAEVEVADRTLRVKRVTCAIDCGPVVNPAIVRAQMESGIVYGLSAALYGEITLKDGAVEQSNFTDYDAVRLADAPAMAVHIVDSGAAELGGVGEPGTPPIAPAVANAVFAATGRRLRSLPLRLA
ncbi:MAG: xanthine dehydrogenase family protein molybdopterin-binding subunit [Reyranella sp.]|uniref:xanthine dehydrogenase family protein molybdopterin-binding subunit n=1 Tax=Reyranella sp. TaxID=1929291 RepID=UPI001AD48CC9|nr:molybdopterin cofactor-binding domain-containing protein [Reyranella sp.]MBN9089628.1 xanthine dehydrogenase family protein molybdopterin-binding subunit [Reyranella sp.]